MDFDREDVKRAILKSQHCQRNWDLKGEIPKEDLDLLMTAVSQCPSKQNIAYYKVHFILNRNLIEDIHGLTDGFFLSYEGNKKTTNPQTLANLLVVFESIDIHLEGPRDFNRNAHTYEYGQNSGSLSPESQAMIDRDRYMAVGVAAGYVNLAANLLGYSTGCCACFDPEGVRLKLNSPHQPLLLMGVGFKNQEINRRLHHLDHSILFPTQQKQPIVVDVVP